MVGTGEEVAESGTGQGVAQDAGLAKSQSVAFLVRYPNPWRIQLLVPGCGRGHRAGADSIIEGPGVVAVLRLADEVGVRNLPDGWSARAFVRQQLDRLGLG